MLCSFTYSERMADTADLNETRQRKPAEKHRQMRHSEAVKKRSDRLRREFCGRGFVWRYLTGADGAILR